MRIHHGAWGGSSTTQRLGPGDWLFLSAPVVIVGVAITTAYPLSIAHLVPYVRINNPRDCVGARLKGGGKCLRFGVRRNECGVEEWIFSWASPASHCTPGSSGNQSESSESRYPLVRFTHKVSARFGPGLGVLRVFRRATANVLRECRPPVQLPCGLHTAFLALCASCVLAESIRALRSVCIISICCAGIAVSSARLRPKLRWRWRSAACLCSLTNHFRHLPPSHPHAVCVHSLSSLCNFGPCTASLWRRSFFCAFD